MKQNQSHSVSVTKIFKLLRKQSMKTAQQDKPKLVTRPET